MKAKDQRSDADPIDVPKPFAVEQAQKLRILWRPKRTAMVKHGQVLTGELFTSRNGVRDTVSLVAKRNSVKMLTATSNAPQ